MRKGLTYPAMFMEGGLANYFGPGQRYDVIWLRGNLASGSSIAIFLTILRTTTSRKKAAVD